MVRPGILNRRGEVYVFLGALLTLGIVYCATFPDLWDEFIREGVESYSAPAAVYLAIGMAITAVAAQLVLRARTTLDLGDVAVQLGLLVLAFIVATWPAWTGYAVVFNGVFFALAGAIIAYGYLTGDDRYVNGGLIAIAIGLLTRYVDVFWSLLVNSAFFIVGGALLLALAFVLERARRAILADMNGSDDDGPFPQQEALE
jgi:hypothetical protein